MSIIHEALKKAEREREPRPPGLPLHGGVHLAVAAVPSGESPSQNRGADGARLVSHGAGG